jgi:hypothetical protein
MMAPMDITKVINSNTPRTSPEVSSDGVNVRLVNTSSLPCNMMLIVTDNPPNVSKAKSRNAQTPINRFDTIIARGFSVQLRYVQGGLFLAELSSRGDSPRESVLKKGATERERTKREEKKEKRARIDLVGD